MFCIKCGKQLPDEAAFCFACGAPVFKGGDAAPAISVNTAAEFEVRIACEADGKPEVSKDAVAQLGNLLIDDDKMYFMTHGYYVGTHSQLWESDLKGNNKKCIIDFDSIGYKTESFGGDGLYYLIKIDGLIVIKVYDKNNDNFNYYYDTDRKIHGVLKNTPRLPYGISQNGKYFVDCRYSNEEGCVVVKLTTPWEFINNKPYENIKLRPIDIPGIYTSYKDIKFNEADCYVFNGRHILISFYGDSEYRWLKLNLDDWADIAVLSPAKFLLEDSGKLLGENSLVLFSVVGSNEYVYVDTEDMGIRTAIPEDQVINRYGYMLHLSSYSDEDATVLDLRTGAKKKIPQNVKAFEYSNVKDIVSAAGGFYKYSYHDGDTKIYFMANAELFSEFNGEPYEDGECVPPVVSLSYVREFSPALRNAQNDENVYTRENTKDLDVAASVYLKENDEESFRKNSRTSFFYLDTFVTLPDGRRIGFVYGHKKGFEGCKDYYYNLYELKLDGTYRYLNSGSRGGIEYLHIYKNYAYWKDVMTYRYDFNTGEFIETHDEWLAKEYEDILAKTSDEQL